MTFKSRRRMEAELWFEEFVETLPNRMPDVERRELPLCMMIMQVPEMYAEGTTNPLSLMHFGRMWEEEFRDVIIRKSVQQMCIIQFPFLESTRNTLQ